MKIAKRAITCHLFQNQCYNLCGLAEGHFSACGKQRAQRTVHCSSLCCALQSLLTSPNYNYVALCYYLRVLDYLIHWSLQGSNLLKPCPQTPSRWVANKASHRHCLWVVCIWTPVHGKPCTSWHHPPASNKGQICQIRSIRGPIRSNRWPSSTWISPSPNRWDAPNDADWAWRNLNSVAAFESSNGLVPHQTKAWWHPHTKSDPQALENAASRRCKTFATWMIWMILKVLDQNHQHWWMLSLLEDAQDAQEAYSSPRWQWESLRSWESSLHLLRCPPWVPTSEALHLFCPALGHATDQLQRGCLKLLAKRCEDMVGSWSSARQACALQSSTASGNLGSDKFPLASAVAQSVCLWNCSVSSANALSNLHLHKHAFLHSVGPHHHWRLEAFFWS